jgi:prepilin signal peptidase PulO-like enzyme (type II secretory pathway)
MLEIIFVIFLGLAMGSFVNAAVWRIKQQSTRITSKNTDLSISRGRSMCVNCKHTLAARDLIPLVSWVFLRGKCRYCHCPISTQYPVVEVLTACLFLISYTYWDQLTSLIHYTEFTVWLLVLTGLVMLVIYDIRWMLLPNRIIFPLYGLAGLFIVLQVLEEKSFQPILTSLIGILIGGGIFYALFQVSDGKWIGGGDVKLGFLLGALVGGPLPSFLLLFLASLIACISVIPLYSTKKLKRNSRIPFGPYLIISGFIVFHFGASIIDWYASKFIRI